MNPDVLTALLIIRCCFVVALGSFDGLVLGASVGFGSNGMVSGLMPAISGWNCVCVAMLACVNVSNVYVCVKG